MFAVIISEKGGAERRETFDRTEINVGRVQGNDLMLPKGNVSKRHARLLYRDGRFIVTDLKSTNGTYVNGRKIAQATIVREGDKIYIGDFVLRIETTAGGAQVSDDPAPIDQQSGSDVGPSPGSGQSPVVRSSGPRIEHRGPDGKLQDIVSHFPLEHDPDDSVPYAVPGPPRVPTGARPAAGAGTRSGPPPMNTTAANAVGRTTAPSVGVTGPPIPSPLPSASPSAVPISPLPVARRALTASDRAPAPDPVHMAAHRTALAALVERVASALEPDALVATPPSEATAAAVDRALGERIAVLRAEGHIPSDIDPEALVAEARRELLDLGPVGLLLSDEDTTEVQVVRHDFVVALQGRRQVHSEVAFSSEQALSRCIRRLCALSGRPLAEGESYVERRLPQGARMFALVPPSSGHGHVLVLRKPHRADLTLEDLVRSGTISRAIAGLLSQCVGARANILVTGAVGAGATSLLGALASAGSTDDRVIVLQEEDELIFNQPHTVSILLGDSREEGARAVQAAARIHPDRLVIGSFSGRIAAEVVEAIGEGADGVLAAARAPTLRQAISRLTADLAGARPGLTAETAGEWLGSAFDLVLEIARLRDGRHRVLRVAELALEASGLIVRDVFTFSVERTAAGGAVEGAFHPTGVIPAIVDDLAARGVSLDSSIFKRAR